MREREREKKSGLWRVCEITQRSRMLWVDLMCKNTATSSLGLYWYSTNKMGSFELREHFHIILLTVFRKF